MEVLPLLQHFLALAFLMLLFTTFATSFSDYEAEDEPSRCKFERVDEARRECNSFLSSASKFELDDNRVRGIATKLTFHNGDWVQESGEARLMSFDDSDMPKNYSGPGSLLKLVSFQFADIDFTSQLENAISICGDMSIGISRNRTLNYMSQGGSRSPRFSTWPGFSELSIPFEGLYMESEENGGERLLCLLGTLPFPLSEASTYPFEEETEYSCHHDYQSPFSTDDRVLLVLRYPQHFTLTSRAILGEMRSLNEKSDPKYFDRVHISSQFDYQSDYQFVSEKLVAKACDPYPYQDKLIDDGIQLFKGSQFCNIFQKFGPEMFDIVADSKCDDTNEYCNILGPFVLGSETKAINGMLENFRLMMMDFRCMPGNNLNKAETAKVSAVFRALSPLESQSTAEARTSLSGMTISAEGTWNSSSGQLCMVGCVGLVEAGSDHCNSRICLYLPITFSITQRSIVIGTICSIKNTNSYSPLFFKKALRPLDLWNRHYDYSKSYLSYRYSKTDVAGAFLKSDENLVTFLKKSFLEYPNVEDTDNITALSFLSIELSFGVYALPDPLPNSYSSKTFVEIEVLSLGPLLGRCWPHLRGNSCQKKETEFPINIDSSRQKLPLNISAQLSLTGEFYSHISLLFLEGLYDPHRGKMYLIGCRNVPKARKFNNVKLESRMDCMIEVKVEYSSKTARWLINPTAKVSIASQRDKEDPLYFSPISFQTFLLKYDNTKECMFRQNFEEAFRILVLIASIGCILGQLSHLEKRADVIPFMSLVMLGAQAIGYGLPLITGGTILFKWKEFEYYYSRHSWKNCLWFQSLDCTLKFLLLCTLVLTLELCRKVWKSRARLLTNESTQLKQNPNDKRVLLFTLMIHMVGFVVVHILHSMNTEEIVHNHSEWVTEMEEYMGLVQDFFLLPQIIGNVIWRIQSKPLRKMYFIGFTVLRLLVRIYDYIRDPVFNPYDQKNNFDMSPKFFFKSEDIVIMATLAIFAIIVYAQQRWNFDKLNQILKGQQNNPSPIASGLHKYLLSK